MAATGKTTSGQAAEHAEAGKAYYAALFPDVGVGYFAALWHTVTVGHLVAGNLEQIARRHGVGIGDLHVLGFLGFQEDQSLRPTDLARALFLTNAAITRRLNHLAARGFVASGPAGKDRRSTWISLTPAGRAVVEAALKDIGQNSNFGRVFRTLPAMERDLFEALIAKLHVGLSRFFSSTPIP